MAHRKSRIASLIIKNITDIIQFELKNPKIGFVTVTDSEVNSDNTFAKIFVSFMGVSDTLDRFHELKSAKGYIRSSLAKKLDVYKVPDFAFLLDDSFERNQKINEVIQREADKLKNK
jgi:ribosome-binding factor A